MRACRRARRESYRFGRRQARREDKIRRFDIQGENKSRQQHEDLLQERCAFVSIANDLHQLLSDCHYADAIDPQINSRMMVAHEGGGLRHAARRKRSLNCFCFLMVLAGPGLSQATKVVPAFYVVLNSLTKNCTVVDGLPHADTPNVTGDTIHKTRVRSIVW